MGYVIKYWTSQNFLGCMFIFISMSKSPGSSLAFCSSCSKFSPQQVTNIPKMHRKTTDKNTTLLTQLPHHATKIETLLFLHFIFISFLFHLYSSTRPLSRSYLQRSTIINVHGYAASELMLLLLYAALRLRAHTLWQQLSQGTARSATI